MEQLTAYHLNSDIDTLSHHQSRRTATPCFLYLLEGNGFLKIGNATHPFTTGQCCLIPDNTDHSYWAENKNWKYLWILFDGPIFKEILPKTAFSAENPIANCSEEQVSLFEIIKNHRYQYHGQEYYDNLSILVKLCASFIGSFPSPRQLISDNSGASIRSFIKNNISRSDLNVKLLMQVTGLGRTALYSRFKKEGRSSINAYIRGNQITKAKHLLRSTELPINQVAFSVGFEDPLYFSRVFKQLVGAAPSAYRDFYIKQNKEQEDFS